MSEISCSCVINVGTSSDEDATSKSDKHMEMLSRAVVDVAQTLGELGANQAQMNERVERVESMMKTILEAVTATQDSHHQLLLEAEITKRMQCEEEIERLTAQLAGQSVPNTAPCVRGDHARETRPQERARREPERRPEPVPEEPLDPRWFGSGTAFDPHASSSPGPGRGQPTGPSLHNEAPLSPNSKALAEELRIGQDKEAQDQRTRRRQEAAERERAEEEARRDEERRRLREKSQQHLAVFEFDQEEDASEEAGLFALAPGVSTSAATLERRPAPVSKGLFDDDDNLPPRGGLFDDDERDV